MARSRYAKMASTYQFYVETDHHGKGIWKTFCENFGISEKNWETKRPFQ